MEASALVASFVQQVVGKFSEHFPLALSIRRHHSQVGGVTRIRVDIHQTLCVLEPALMARPLSCQAPSLLATLHLHPWHLSETFKCLLISLSTWPAQPRQRRNDIWDEGGVGSASPAASSSCQFGFSLHIWRLRQLPCHLEMHGGVTRFENSVGRRRTWAVSLENDASGRN